MGLQYHHDTTNNNVTLHAMLHINYTKLKDEESYCKIQVMNAMQT